ncbi:pyrophosphate-dependent phosphofructose kinase [Ectocarpus siliculosus]|uniref:Pyrophosphate-dependent phosphofructose kinase n=1 Tax=Ectocarpus siliculosus TaxID=2880 RepID=D7G165_ECTSI|nr:pyrophosphate-dependent phosphofructose kinase [Ectocarpus siliculosus]|eukprot:CBJ33175.1 pyrophosphate-dependent phosphofructose kinase [Ectocarpus siliculosus]
MVATALLAVSAVASAAAASNAGGVVAGAGLPAFASPPTVDGGRALGSWATAAAAGAAGRKTTWRHAEAEATGVAFGGEGRAMDRASQAESKYREALEEALRAAREHGDSSPQAVAAWDVVDEIEASNNSIAWRPALDQACSVAGEGDDMELCMEYNKDLDRLKEILQPSDTAEEEERERFTIEEIVPVPVPNLKTKFKPSGVANLDIASDSLGSVTHYTKLIGEQDIVLYEHVRGPGRMPAAKGFLRAGPRASLHFKPTEVRAAVVTCGGLCPGLNSVIHHLVLTLFNIYDAEKVFGIVGGFAGFWDENHPPREMSVKDVELVQHEGGSILGSARGGFDLDKIIDFINDNQINQLYIIGGDGTHRGAVRIATECMARDMNVAVAGVPKTIDNDVDIIDRSFGFQTSVEAAQHAIESATTEARCAIPNGVGVVKLMGRSSGFIAAMATLASGDVDLCLVPESDIVLDGPRGCLPHIMKRVRDGRGTRVSKHSAADKGVSSFGALSYGQGCTLVALLLVMIISCYYVKLAVRCEGWQWQLQQKLPVFFIFF